MARSTCIRRILATLMLTTLGAHADVPAPQDFAFGLRVETQGDHALWRLELPERIYRKARRADLGDLGVYNAAGEPVPFTLRPPERPQADTPAPRAVPFFALPAPAQGEAVSSSVRIVTDDDGTIVDVSPRDEAPHADARVAGYLIDLTGLEDPVTGLRLSWEPGDGAGFTASVDVSRSVDLSGWRTLVSGAPLADLASGGHALTRREIEWSGGADRYLRLSWPEVLRGVRLTGVQALFAEQRASLPRRWVGAAGQPVPGEDGTYAFDAGGYFPVDRVRLQLGPDNAVVETRLLSRPDRQAQWQPRYEGIVYHLRKDGILLRSDPVALRPRPHPYWRAQIQGTPDGTPRLQLGWVPRTLTFVAQGHGPYTVAYGSATARPPQRPLEALLQSIDGDRKRDLIGDAQAGASVVLGGTGRLEPPPEPLPWRLWLLWAVLGMGVLILALMVRRLYRQLARSDSPE